MSITKSIRLEPDELQRIEPVLELMPGSSEAAALKHMLMLGLGIQQKDAVELLFTRDGLTTGEIAERLNMSRLEVIHILEERHVRMLDIPVEAFEQDLRRTDFPGGLPPEA